MAKLMSGTWATTTFSVRAAGCAWAAPAASASVTRIASATRRVRECFIGVSLSQSRLRGSRLCLHGFPAPGQVDLLALPRNHEPGHAVEEPGREHAEGRDHREAHEHVL